MVKEIDESIDSGSDLIKPDQQTMHPLVSWRSMTAGLFVSFIIFVGLVGLGMAFGGFGMNEQTTMKRLGLFSGIWTLISTIIALFIGSYFAARISRFKAPRIGSAQGLVIAALFLSGLLFETILAIGSATHLTRDILGQTSSMIETPIERVADAPVVKDVVQDVVGNLILKNDPNLVTAGITARLLRGDDQAAANYLADQADISTIEARERISDLKIKVDSIVQKAKLGAASAFRATGLSLFLLVFLGAIFSVFGGSLGSMANFKRPLQQTRRVHFSGEQRA
jgi:hypothetical protein